MTSAQAPSSKVSSGTLLYRPTRAATPSPHVQPATQDPSLEILLVHPAGNFNRRAPWGIPKGQPNEREALEAAARRETLEETGLVCGDLVDLGHIDYSRSTKRVYCFAGPAPEAAPHCASWEVDKVGYIDLARARRIIHPDQVIFIDRLIKLLGLG